MGHASVDYPCLRSGRFGPCHIFCDLDGVLVDFDRGVLETTGYSPQEWEHWEENRSSMWRLLAWQRGFFARLPWTDDGRELWRFLEPLCPSILTGSPRGNWAKPQKQAWCEYHLKLPKRRVNVVAAGQKRQYA